MNYHKLFANYHKFLFLLISEINSCLFVQIRVPVGFNSFLIIRHSAYVRVIVPNLYSLKKQNLILTKPNI